MSNTRVYFIKSARSNAVKIGVAEDPLVRLSALQTGSVPRLTLIAEMPGDERYERVLHEAFDEYRIKGEWFRLEGRLAALVAALPAMYAHPDRLPRRRAKIAERPRMKPDPRLRKYWAEFVLPEIQKAVRAIGLREFAKACGERNGDIARAVYERGRRFSGEHWCILVKMVDKPTALRLTNMVLMPFGFEALSDEEREIRRQNKEYYERLRASVIVEFGVDEGQKVLAEMDAEIEQVRLERERKRDADPYAYTRELLSRAA